VLRKLKGKQSSGECEQLQLFVCEKEKNAAKIRNKNKITQEDISNIF